MCVCVCVCVVFTLCTNALWAARVSVVVCVHMWWCVCPVWCVCVPTQPRLDWDSDDWKKIARMFQPNSNWGDHVQSHWAGNRGGLCNNRAAIMAFTYRVLLSIDTHAHTQTCIYVYMYMYTMRTTYIYIYIYIYMQIYYIYAHCP